MLNGSIRYRQLLRDPRWQKRRLKILERDEWRCQRCCATDRELQIHHHWYITGFPWEAPDDALVTLCRECHRSLSMPQNRPVLSNRQEFRALYAPLQIAHSDCGHWFMIRDEIV